MTAENEKTRIFYLHCFIGCTLLFCFRFVPAMGPITSTGMQVVGVFLGMLYLWMTLGCHAWINILTVIALSLTDYCSITEVLQKGLGSTTVWQFISIMTLTGAIAISGCGEIIARWMITRKIVAGRPLLFLYMFILMCFITTSFLNTPMIFIAWMLVYSIVEQVGYQKGDKFVTLFIIGAFLGCNLGFTLWPFTGMRIAYCSAFSSAAGIPVDFATYIIVALVTAIVSIAIYVLSMKYVFKTDFSKLENLDLDQLKSKDMSLSYQSKAYLGGFLIAVIYILAIMIMPAEWKITQLLSIIGTNNIFPVIVVALCIFRKEGKPLLDFTETAHKGILWDVMTICCAILPVSQALADDSIGIKALIASVMDPIFGGHGALFFIAVITILGVVFTNFAANVAVALVLIQVAVVYAGQVGVDAMMIGIMVIMACQMAFFTPASSVDAAILHSNNWLEKNELYKYTAYICAFIMFVLVFISSPVCSLLRTIF